MPQLGTNALKAHRKREPEESMTAGKAWQDSGLVFTSPIGTPLDPRNVTREFQACCLRPLACRACVFTISATRRNVATRARRRSAHDHGDARHSQISLTLNTYSHVLPALQIEAAAKVDAILSR